MSPETFLLLCRRNERLFWARLGPRTPDICWEWSGANDGRKGYGHLKLEGTNVKAHRVAYALSHGQISRGLEVLHGCDNPRCCNPAHLSIGTHDDNMADMAKKGRASRKGQQGEANPRAKLTADNVVEIRRLIATGEKNTRIASRFGVGDDIISKIRTGKAWVA